MGRRLSVPIILGLGLLGALIAAAAFSSASVSFRSADRDGARVSEVLIGERVVIVLRTTAGGYTPLERAEIVANRLRSAMARSMEQYEVEAAPVPGGHGVYMDDQLIVAVYSTEADAHGATTEALASLWRDNISIALGAEVAEEPSGEAPQAEAEPAPEPAPAGEQGPASAAEVQAIAEPEVVDWTGASQKLVPVFSLEREGVRLGMAQVAGPTSQVEKVKGVAQLRLDFKHIGRIYAYIPVSSISTKLDRVQGVSVWALVDVKVLNF
ncbi:MAG: hypothetical protein JSV79_08750 [Armatimonadota bacterium]|nr:MAG: hypothetical protein JSV79_08750 [Armatimonadota bacterium]